MTVSAWWVIWAFVVGGYFGALVVGLMTVASRRRGVHERVVDQGFVPASARRLGAPEMYGSV